MKKSYSRTEIDRKAAFNTFYEHIGLRFFLKFILYSKFEKQFGPVVQATRKKFDCTLLLSNSTKV